MTRQTAFWLAAASLTVGALGTGGWAPVAAEEVRQGLNAPMILQMLSKPVDKPEAVMREMLRSDAISARPIRSEGQVMPTGRFAMAARPQV